VGVFLNKTAKLAHRLTVGFRLWLRKSRVRTPLPTPTFAPLRMPNAIARGATVGRPTFSNSCNDLPEVEPLPEDVLAGPSSAIATAVADASRLRRYRRRLSAARILSSEPLCRQIPFGEQTGARATSGTRAGNSGLRSSAHVATVTTATCERAFVSVGS
jgi:hypothetical protein